MTDEFPAYHKALGEMEDKHKTVNHASGEYALGDIQRTALNPHFRCSSVESLERGIV